MRYHMMKRQNGCDTPFAILFRRRDCAIWGGISHWAAKGLAACIASASARDAKSLAIWVERREPVGSEALLEQALLKIPMSAVVSDASSNVLQWFERV